MRVPSCVVVLSCALVLLGACRRSDRTVVLSAPSVIPDLTNGLALTNQVNAKRPWSIYVARIARTAETSIHSVHAQNAALGLTPLSQQVRGMRPDAGVPLAAVNGDFYQRERAYAGDPRGLQIVEGELISAPCGTASFWCDEAGIPHVANVRSEFAVTWPDGSVSVMGLNEERRATNVVLYTPAIGSSTKTSGGLELVLKPETGTAWGALRVGTTFTASVAEPHEGGNTRLTNGVLVLSIGPTVSKRLALAPGARLKISTATVPDVKGATAAIGGGPLLVRDGKALKIDPTGLFDPKSYSARSMLEEHPRTAIGWNGQYFFFVEVDGRQKSSIGMTLEQLRDYMLGLGCENAMNLDGGGSATLWCNGAVVNHPCDGSERPIANGLVATRKVVQSAQR